MTYSLHALPWTGLNYRCGLSEVSWIRSKVVILGFSVLSECDVMGRATGRHLFGPLIRDRYNRIPAYEVSVCSISGPTTHHIRGRWAVHRIYRVE